MSASMWILLIPAIGCYLSIGAFLWKIILRDFTDEPLNACLFWPIFIALGIGGLIVGIVFLLPAMAIEKVNDSLKSFLENKR